MNGLRFDMDTKSCPNCGKPIQWRKSWERKWNDVAYCEGNCRRNKLIMNA